MTAKVRGKASITQLGKKLLEQLPYPGAMPRPVKEHQNRPALGQAGFWCTRNSMYRRLLHASLYGSFPAIISGATIVRSGARCDAASLGGRG
jgi:hypothetical protein